MAFAPEEIHQLLTHVVDETALICAAIGKEILGPPAARAAVASRNRRAAPAQ